MVQLQIEFSESIGPHGDWVKNHYEYLPSRFFISVVMRGKLVHQVNKKTLSKEH